MTRLAFRTRCAASNVFVVRASNLGSGVALAPRVHAAFLPLSRMRFQSLVPLLALATVAACGSGGSTPPAIVVTNVTVSSAVTVFNQGQSAQFSAKAYDASGAVITNPGNVFWSSTATDVATVDQTGKV